MSVPTKTPEKFKGIDTKFLAEHAAFEMNRYGAITNLSEEDALSIAIHCMWLYRAAEVIKNKDMSKYEGKLISELLGSDEVMEKHYSSSADIMKELMAMLDGSAIVTSATECEALNRYMDEKIKPVTEKEFLKNPVAQIVPEVGKADPDGIDQHAPGAKLDYGKVKASLLIDFGRAILAVAEVGTYGANKYTRGGWQHVSGGFTRYTDALLRHIFAEQVEEFDPETKILHAAHTAWNALARLELLLRENRYNTTVPSGQARTED